MATYGGRVEARYVFAMHYVSLTRHPLSYSNVSVTIANDKQHIVRDQI